MPEWQTEAEQCSWYWREGGGLGLWAEACQFPSGERQVVWAVELDAFVSRTGTAIGEIVVQSWALPPESGIEALTEALVESGYLPEDAPCEWQTMTLRYAPRTMGFHRLAPIASDALSPTAQGEVPEPLCGSYGASTHGVRFFITDPRWPDRAIFVDAGQERPMFDYSSITLLP